MEYVMLDRRDDDRILSRGVMETLPGIDEAVVFDADDVLGAWRVVSRTFLMVGPKVCILQLMPKDVGEWDGSADAYLQQAGFPQPDEAPGGLRTPNAGPEPQNPTL
tara:strand:+ start:146 stop:463 length:318 start_codon:yes stop_codon:yes gene_type:complete